MPKDTRVVGMTYHVPRIWRNDRGDIRIPKADFERLDGTPKATMSLWKMSEEYLA